jgi:hypothetical protein
MYFSYTNKLWFRFYSCGAVKQHRSIMWNPFERTNDESHAHPSCDSSFGPFTCVAIISKAASLTFQVLSVIEFFHHRIGAVFELMIRYVGISM